MDVLSSQANIAGYKAVMMAANTYQRFMPMLMTAAGTVKAARVLIMGVGVAGLQAIATAKRLGAVIEASDVRPPVKEQVESLGAKFIDVPFLTDEEKEIAKGSGGYARADAGRLDAAPGRTGARTRQAGRHRHHHRADPGPPGAGADLRGDGQGHEARLGDRRPGRVARRQLPAVGNEQDGAQARRVRSSASRTWPTLVAADASALYARNVLDFLKLIIDKDDQLVIDREDDILKASLVCAGGEVLRK